MKKIGVILSGCGVYDGSEIHEAVLTLLAISRSGAQAVCFAPDKQQVDVINHLTGEAMRLRLLANVQHHCADQILKQRYLLWF